MLFTKQQLDEAIITKSELKEIAANIKEKQKIQEIIDDDGNIMGDNDTPENTPNGETMASRTTDYNAGVHGQNFKNDFLGRFGFYFYESENTAKPQIYEDLASVVGEDKVNEVMEAIKPHLERVIDEMDTTLVNEAKVVEDKITPNKEDKSIKGEKKKDEISPEKLKKLDDLFSNMPKDQVEKIIKLLEKYR